MNISFQPRSLFRLKSRAFLLTVLLLSFAPHSIHSYTIELEDEEVESIGFSPETIIELIEDVLEKNKKRTSVLDTVHPEFSSRRDLEVANDIKRTRLSFKFQSNDIVNSVAVLSKLTHINIIVSRKARRALKDSDAEINLSFERVDMEYVLDLIAFQLGDFRFQIQYGALSLVHVSEYKPKKYTKYYNITDLIRKPKNFRAPKLGLGGIDQDNDL